MSSCHYFMGMLAEAISDDARYAREKALSGEAVPAKATLELISQYIRLDDDYVKLCRLSVSRHALDASLSPEYCAQNLNKAIREYRAATGQYD